MSTYPLKTFLTAVILCGYMGAAQASGQLRPPIPDDPTFGLADKYRAYKDNAANEEREKARKRARIVPKGAKPVVMIERRGITSDKDPYFSNGIRFNGKHIKNGAPLSRAVEVLGPDFRTYHGTHYWDELGISVHTNAAPQPKSGKPRAEYVKYISIHLNSPSHGTTPPPSEPSRSFSGYLSLDGAGIDKHSRLWEVDALANRKGLPATQPYITCSKEQTLCQIESYGKEHSDKVSFWTDEEHDWGTVYSLEYSFFDSTQNNGSASGETHRPSRFWLDIPLEKLKAR